MWKFLISFLWVAAYDNWIVERDESQLLLVFQKSCVVENIENYIPELQDSQGLLKEIAKRRSSKSESGYSTNLTSLSSFEQRNVALSALELLLHRNPGGDQRQLGDSFESKYLPRSGIEIIKNFHTDGKHVQNQAKKLPCLHAQPEFNMIRKLVEIQDESSRTIYPPSKRDAVPNDPHINSQWHLSKGADNMYSSKAQDAWTFYSGSQDETIIAIVDTGCTVHPDLQENIWINPDYNCSDVDVAKQVDCFGWDFGDDDSNPFDEPLSSIHGTNVAGVVAARPNNDFMVSGVCWNCKIMCLKVYDSYRLGLSSSAIIEANEYIASRPNVRISNHSYGGYGYSSAEERSIEVLRDNGHLFVTAAGNHNCDIDDFNAESAFACKDQDSTVVSPWTPATYTVDNILVVGATDEYGQKADFSNWGPVSVDIFAPGKEIKTTTNTINVASGVADSSGTSYAAPLVAGAAGLLWGSNPDLTYLEVKQALMDTALELPGLKPLAQSGIVDIEKALTHAGRNNDDYREKEPKPVIDLTRQFYEEDTFGGTAQNVFFIGIIFWLMI